MSRAGRPRPRHIAFRLEVDGPVTRRDMGKALEQAARAAGLPDGAVRLTRFEAPHGIASTDHRHDRALRSALPRVDRVAGRPARLETISSSGTIKTLTDRLGLLAERGPKGGRPTRSDGSPGTPAGPQRTPDGPRHASPGPPRAKPGAPRASGGPAAIPGRPAQSD